MSKKIVAIWLSVMMVFGFFVIVDVTIDFVPGVKGTTLYVNTTGTGGAYTQIQSAIDNASDGYTVFVYSGTYYENVVVNKTINLTGEDRDITIINGSGVGDVVRVERDWVNITGFTVCNSGNSSSDTGIRIKSNYNNITNNNVSDNWRGIYLYYSNGSIINGNDVVQNNNAGIDLFSSNRNNITDNNALKNLYGLNLEYFSNGNNIMGNNLSLNRRDGIRNEFSNGNNITDNTASSNYDYGIYIRNSIGTNIINNYVDSNYEIGIDLYRSNRNYIANNTILNNNGYGIWLAGSQCINCTGNIMTNDGFVVGGEPLEDWITHIIDTSNTVDGKPVYYWKNQTSGIIPTGAGQVILANCTNITVKNQNTTNGSYGIHLGYSSNITISDCKTLNNQIGIYLDYSDGNIITNSSACFNELYAIYLSLSFKNIITNNNVSYNIGHGIYLRYSDDNNITDNDVFSNMNRGIMLSYSDYNSIISNKASLNNSMGIALYSSHINNIVDNNVSSNNEYGIFLGLSSGMNKVYRNYVSNNTNCGIYVPGSSASNTIFHNNIINNTNQAVDGTNDFNDWDNNYPLGGNYWSDYNGVDSFKGPNQDQSGSDGIGDTPYVIDINSRDNYPLMEPYTYKPLENYTILKEGWNLISIPLIQKNQTLTKVLEMIDGYYDTVEWYNITDKNDHWKIYNINKPFGNDLFELNESIGFWIHITKSGDTIFLYNGTQPTVNQTITLYPGWNLVGYPSLSNRTRAEALNNIDFGSDVDAIWTFNATSQAWEVIGPSDHFELGRGYWVHALVEKTWDVPL